MAKETWDSLSVKLMTAQANGELIGLDMYDYDDMPSQRFEGYVIEINAHSFWILEASTHERIRIVWQTVAHFDFNLTIS